jgi:hypothetical protein
MGYGGYKHTRRNIVWWKNYLSRDDIKDRRRKAVRRYERKKRRERKKERLLSRVSASARRRAKAR